MKPTTIPVLTLLLGAWAVSATAAPSMSQHGAHAEVKSETSVMASGGYARAMLPGARVGGGYLTLINHGTRPDRLVSASTDRAGSIEIHESTMNDGVMRMRELAGGVDLQPGEVVSMKPGGVHLMLRDVASPLREGERIVLRLRFETAGELQTELLVGPPNATGETMAHHHP